MKNMEQQFSMDLKLNTSKHETQPSNSVREYPSDTSIPDDLLVEIFSRLPRKSIARFRCVSKSLASILRRSDFTQLFLTKSLTRPRLLFTVETNGKLLFYSSPQSHHPDNNSSLVVTRYHTSFPKYVPCDYCRMVYGLVLLQGYRKRKVRVIFNPATGQFLTLPKVLLKEKNLPTVKDKSYPTKIAGIYLGYDPVEKQFKVLCMTSSRDERPNTHQILTLGSGKRLWRMVEHKFHFVEDIGTYGEVCINGVLYFGASLGQSSRIVCFDVASEKFSFINMSEDINLIGSCFSGALTLFNYKGKLGINNDRYENRLVLWVLEDAANHKWSEHSYVSPLGSQLFQYNRFVGMTSTGEVVLESYHWRSASLCASFYNLKSETFKRVYFQGLNYVTPDIFLDYVENIKFM